MLPDFGEQAEFSFFVSDFQHVNVCTFGQLCQVAIIQKLRYEVSYVSIPPLDQK